LKWIRRNNRSCEFKLRDEGRVIILSTAVAFQHH